MTLTDPVDWRFGQVWPPMQFWKCGQCGRNFWTTYPAPKPPAPPKPAAPPKEAVKPPAAGASSTKPSPAPDAP